MNIEKNQGFYNHYPRVKCNHCSRVFCTPSDPGTYLCRYCLKKPENKNHVNTVNGEPVKPLR